MKKLLAGVIVVLVIGAGAFAGGYWYGGTRYGAQNMTLTIEAQDAQKKLAVAESLTRLMRARVALFQAAGQLDQRNFGLASTHVKDAAAALAQVDPAAVGIDAGSLNAVRSELGKLDLNVAADLEEQRRQVLDLGKQLDALIPK